MRDGREEEIRNIVGELLEDYKDDRQSIRLNFLTNRIRRL